MAQGLRIVYFFYPLLAIRLAGDNSLGFGEGFENK